jgi:hypothetical protein
MTAIRYLLSNLQAYLHADAWYSIFIAACFLFAGYVLSFIFFKKGQGIGAVARVLTGNLILIHIGWVLLFCHLISPIAIAAVLILLCLAVIFFRGITFNEVKTKAAAWFAQLKNDKYASVFILVVFLFFLPKAFNGFLRWDEMSYHLAYPQHWVNQGGFVVDYSMQYPVYSFGLHILYTLLLVFGTAATVKVYTGFFLLFFLMGIRNLLKLFNAPSYLTIIFVLFILTIDFFNEWTFTAMLEPVLWTYTLYLVTELFKMVRHTADIPGQKFTFFLPALLLFAALINIKSFFLVYTTIFAFFFVAVSLFVYRVKVQTVLKQTIIIAAVIILPNLVNFIVCLLYSGDPFFPLLTMNFGDHFTKIWDKVDISAMHESVQSTDMFSRKTPILLLVTLLVNLVLMLYFVFRKRKQQVMFPNKSILFLLLSCFISLVVTQFLFPGIIRYSYFLLPTFFLCLMIVMTLTGRRIGIVLSVLMLGVCISPQQVTRSLGYYSSPFDATNIREPNLDRIMYGEQTKIYLFTYLSTQKDMRSVRLCYLASYKYLLLRNGITIIGNYIGVNRFDRICNCDSDRSGYLVIPKENIGSINCDVLYQNGNFIVCKCPN